MNKVILKWIALCSTILILLLACNKEKPFLLKEIKGFYIPSRMEEFFGTWINADYEGQTTQDAKLIINDNGFLRAYKKIDQLDTNDTGVMTIVKKWRNSDGSIWYITYYRGTHGGESLSISKINNGNTTMESFWVSPNVAGSQESLMEKNLTPSHPHYRIFHRQTVNQ